jgi:hypothetical protein
VFLRSVDILIISKLFLDSMALSVLRRATSRTAGIRLPVGAREFSRLHNVQTGSGAQGGGHFPLE